jgi:putative membrane protein
MTIIPLASLPAVNATLNAVCTFFLLIGFAFIRNGKIRWHRAAMLCAFFCSITFLGFYVYFHVHAGLIRFGGQGWIRPVYFTLLVSHTILAITTLPLVIITLAYALSERFSSHRRIAHWTYPIWLYVSVTGVIVYWLLYIAYTPIGAPTVSRISLPLLHALL